MKYRKVGKYGISISEISLGSWLTYGGSFGDDITKKCVRTAYDLGINHFDTADQYGYGQTHAGAAEESLGRVLPGYSRSSYVLATKVFWPVGDGINDRGLSRKHLFEQCSASLKKLNVDYIDIYYCHRFDTTTPLEETLMALDDLVRQGKILYIGVSEWSAAQILQAKGITERYGLNPIIVNQPCYNMLYRNIEEEIMPVCEAEGIGLAVWSPIAQGVLTGKYSKGGEFPKDSRASDASAMNGMIEGYLSDENLDKIEKLKLIAADYGVSLANLALAWALNHNPITSVITGASKPEQIEQNVKAIDISIDSRTMKNIDDILTATK